MTTLTIMRGISGSGKTTIARTLGGHRVSRDDLRAELTGRMDKFVGDNAFEDKVSRIQRDTVRRLLMQRYDVVIDDTNLRLRYAQAWANMANDYGAEFRVYDVQTPLEVALSRDLSRIPWVGRSVIERQHASAQWDEVKASPSHPFVDWTPYAPPTGAQSAFIFDIDGTLAIKPNGYSPYDPAHYPEDTPNVPVAITLAALTNYGKIVIMSGRGSEHREATEKWLRSKGIFYDYLYMREEDDKRRDDAVKVDLFNKHVRGAFNIRAVFDDRDRVVEAWRAIGLSCFQVAPGAF